MQYNAGQLEGIEKIVKWFNNGRPRKPVFFVTGQAGTGKTSFARGAVEALGLRGYEVVYIAPTGKAASRLRQKGCDGAKTLHQFVYNVRGEDEEGEPIFQAKGYLDQKPRLVVLDEGSMVGKYDMDTLLSHCSAVLALGDLGQLLPVNAPQSLTPAMVDHELTEIMRQAEGSNIIRAASYLRKGRQLPLREYDDVKVRAGKPPLQQLLDHADENTQILCSYNKTRVALNNEIRAALGFSGNTPQKGEKVMCWFNQHDRGFMNGEQGIVQGYEEARDDEYDENDPAEMLMLVIKSLTTGKTKRVKFNPLSFDPDETISKDALKAPGGFQFGYVATIHKSQGSEWSRVLLVEEPMGDYAKLMYTGATRAQEHLTIYRP
jgi:exodeoxyribonuclease V